MQNHYVLVWKRDIAVLTAGDVKVTMNARIRLMPSQQHHSHNKDGAFGLHNGAAAAPASATGDGINAPSSSAASSSSSSDSSTSALRSRSYNLEIQNVRANDAGEYVCQIGTLVPKEIVHSLEVLGTYISPHNGQDRIQQPINPSNTHTFTCASFMLNCRGPHRHFWSILNFLPFCCVIILTCRPPPPPLSLHLQFRQKLITWHRRTN